MKKLTFFVAVLISLNASVVVRKPEEEENSTSTVKEYSMEQKQTYAMWLQQFVQNLSVYFYGISKTGEIQAFSWGKIQQMIKKKDSKSLKKVNNNWLLYRHHEEGEFSKTRNLN